jgi:chemotaxis protein methyltransferase CheR
MLPFGAELTITDDEFEAFRRLVHETTGIALGPHKRALVQARLGRRLRALGLTSFRAYHRYLTERDSGQELERFVNAITTNKTEFFREAHHFRFLAEQWAPAVVARAARTGARRLRLWSAACSTGEEPYTIAMTVREALGASASWDLRILASDVDTDVLARAEAGIYTADQVAPVPAALRSRYFEPAPDGRGVRVRSALRDLVAFRQINFQDDHWPIRTRFDAIFCRNVLIYFDREGQRRILERLVALLVDDGLLFLGHSESVLGLLAGMRHVGNTIYRKAGGSSAG